MKFNSFIAILLCAATFSVNAQNKKPATGKPTTQPPLGTRPAGTPRAVPPVISSSSTSGSVVRMTKADSLSYSFGILIGKNLQMQGIEELNPKMVSQGLEEMIRNQAPKFSLDQANAIVQSYMGKLQEVRMAAKLKEFEPNKLAGEKFLTENKARQGVVTLPNGLQYEIMAPGTGEKPKASDKVKVHYHGTVIDGTVFDSSVQRGEPATFGVTQVIQGWIEILQMMPVGSKWKVFIPQELAYGTQQRGEAIKPYSALIFEIELLEIVK
jgi:FKBP-type peptidyl-prolyl cis-trans isomerase FklB